MIYRLRKVTAKNMEMRMTRKVQPETASCGTPRISDPVNFTNKALMMTPMRNKKDRIKIQSSKERRKEVKEVMATREVRKRSEKFSSGSIRNGLSTSIALV